MRTIARWWNTERKNRAEKDSSQDMLPTYGDVVMFVTVWGSLWVALAIVIVTRR